jgi:uncharacterized protein (TIGR03435 family)
MFKALCLSVALISAAVQEQLGLKLVPEKTLQPIFVVDHLERPTEN